jgi:precorrin-6B methylase 1
MPKAKVYLVGAGPGDADLITLKGFRLIAAADVILYDRLIPPELLKLAKPQTEIISVAKSADRHEIPQEKINSLIIEKAKQNKIVLRLKGGDPLLFAARAEEAMACVEADRIEIVPGVTSALAAPAYAGIPPTHRDYTQPRNRYRPQTTGQTPRNSKSRHHHFPDGRRKPAANRFLTHRRRLLALHQNRSHRKRHLLQSKDSYSNTRQYRFAGAPAGLKTARCLHRRKSR